MLETPHVVVGAAIASKIANPVLAIPLALGSHFLLEKIPHWNPHLNKETEKYGKPTQKSTIIAAVDATVAFTLGLFISSLVLPDKVHALTIVGACLASSAPDIIEGPYFFLGLRNKLLKKWIDFQKSIQVDSEFLPGLLTQAITVLAAFWWILG